MSFDYDTRHDPSAIDILRSTLRWCPPDDDNFKAAMRESTKAELGLALRHRIARGHKTGADAIRAEINRRTESTRREKIALEAATKGES